MSSPLSSPLPPSPLHLLHQCDQAEMPLRFGKPPTKVWRVSRCKRRGEEGNALLYRPMSQNHEVLTQVDLRYWRRFSVVFFRCSFICHPGPCSPQDQCKKKVKVNRYTFLLSMSYLVKIEGELLMQAKEGGVPVQSELRSKSCL